MSDRGHLRYAEDKFVFSRFLGEEQVYVGFPETQAGASGAVLVPISILKRGIAELKLDWWSEDD